MVCGEEKRAELMGVDLQVDPYFVESEGAESETVEARFLPGPPEATQSQAEDHRASGQIPFRSWCTECVLTRRTGEQHRRRQDKRGTLVFLFDYVHLDEAANLVARDAG